MTLHTNHSHHGEPEPEGHDSCVEALARIQEFLHGELAEGDCDVIREHLAACDSCLDVFDAETAIAALIRRCQPRTPCPSTLRARITSMSITITRFE